MRALIDNTKLCFSFSEHTFSSSSSVAKKENQSIPHRNHTILHNLLFISQAST
jgi:hypothetical protein